MLYTFRGRRAAELQDITVKQYTFQQKQMVCMDYKEVTVIGQQCTFQWQQIG